MQKLAKKLTRFFRLPLLYTRVVFYKHKHKLKHFRKLKPVFSFAHKIILSVSRKFRHLFRLFQKRFPYKFTQGTLVRLAVLGLVIFAFFGGRNIYKKYYPVNYAVSKNYFGGYYKYENKNENFTANFVKKLDPGKPWVEFSHESLGIDMALAQEGQKEMAPKVEQQGTINRKSKIIYTDILPDTDLTYNIIDKGVKEEIVVKNSDLAKKAQKALSYKFLMRLRNTVPQKAAEGIYNPVFFDKKTGKYAFHFLKPVMIDAKGNQSDKITLKVNPKENDEYEVIVIPSMQWLAEKDREYPVRIDPTVVHDTEGEFDGGTALNRVESIAGPKVQSSYHELPTDKNTVLLWHMNETSNDSCSGSKDACDSSGRGNHGTATGTTIDTTNQKLGAGARSFNGTSDYIDAGTIFPTGAAAWSNFSVEMWVKPTSVATSVLMVQSPTGTERAGDMDLYIQNTTGQIRFDRYTGVNNKADSVVTNSSSVIAGTWNHIAATWEGGATGKRKIYLNGVEQASTNTDNLDIGDWNINSTLIGGGYPSYYFPGLMDEVRILNRTLTPEEIKADAQRFPYGIYDSPVIDSSAGAGDWNYVNWTENGVMTGDGENLKSGSGLVAQWNFNLTSGTVATNDGGASTCGGVAANCNGTLYGFVNTTGQDIGGTAVGSGWTADNRRWGAGALMFDGTSDYINTGITAIPRFNFTSQDFSIEGWFNFNLTSGTGIQDLAGNGTYTSRGYFFNWYGSDRKIHFQTNGVSGSRITTSKVDPFKFGEWSHIAVTRSGTSARIYVNGIDVTETAASHENPVTTGDYFIIGAWPQNPAAANWFNGSLDSLRVYSRALSADEVLSNYNVGNIEFQTRTGATADPNDGSWENWEPSGAETQVDSLDDYSPAGCTGGTILEGGRIHKFTTSDTFTCTGSGNVEVLVVAGGGGGGMDMGGGGGGGGVIHNRNYNITAGTAVTVTVGIGGSGAPAAGTLGQPTAHQYTVPATNGTNSVFGTLTAVGGGAGGSSYRGYTPGISGSNGGSGGGSGGYNDNAGTFYGGSGTAGQGFGGGNSTAAYYSGGGGGAGGPGVSSTSRADGGIGYYSDILGSGYYWGGGGGGAGYTIGGGNGGSGGGGGGAGSLTYGGSGLNNGSPGGGGCTVCWTNFPGGDGGDNTGGGGGGGGHYNYNNRGGDGGSGVVIVRLSPLSKESTTKIEGDGSQKINTNPASQIDDNTLSLWHLDETGGSSDYLKDSAGAFSPIATGGTVTYTQGYTIHTFTSSGTFTPPSAIDAEVLIVGGGGGGGEYVGGGGGGGGVYHGKVNMSASAHTITVGNGGSGGSGGGTDDNTNGGSSSIVGGSLNLVAVGGGSGARFPDTSGTAGGSGGGAGGCQSGGGTGGAGQQPTSSSGGYGNRGGNMSGSRSNNDTEGRGGGGAGGTGGDTDCREPGDAGNGVPSSIYGKLYYFGGGGGGGAFYGADYGTARAGNGGMGGGGGGGAFTNGTTGSGGTGGTVNGETPTLNMGAAGQGIGGAGGANTGGGGGGCGHYDKGGNGGSGVVVIRYPSNLGSRGSYSNGTPTGTTSVDGFSGKARYFGGSSSHYITVPDNQKLTFGTGNFTIDFWVKPEVINGNYEGLMGTYNGSSGFIFTTSFGTDGHIAWWNTTNGWIDTGVSLDLNVWQHLAVTRTAGTITIYKNGNVINTTGSWTGDIDGTDLIIGGWNASYAYLTGSLDEIRINSGFARSAEEIAETYRAGRDKIISQNISSADFSTESKIPFYVAADRPGTYLQATAGESAFANYEPDANTMGLWHLDEKTGAANTYIKDSSGKSNSTAISGTSFIQGKMGGSRGGFGGSSNYIAVGSAPTLNPSSAMTISGWIYPTGSQTGNGEILCHCNSSTDAYQFYLTTGSAPHGVYLSVWNTSGTSYTAVSPSVIPDNQWTYVTGVFDSSTNTVKIYINGMFKGVTTTSGTLRQSSIIVYMGIHGGSPSTNNYTGGMDEIRIDNIARTPSEIRQAYEVGKRTHNITIDFAASLDSGNLISGTADTSFTINSQTYGAQNKGDNLYAGDKIIVKENYNGTEYMAQGTVASVNNSTGAVTVISWDSGSNAPSGGYTTGAVLFKWQREYWDMSGIMSNQRDAVTKISLKMNDGNEGRTVYLDDINSFENYLTAPTASGNIANSDNRYLQYRSVLSSSDKQVTPYLSQVTVDYTPIPSPPTNVSATDGTYTDKVTITWTKSLSATGYRVYRDGTQVGGDLGDVATYDDTGAGAPTITPGAASASDGTSKSYVTLSLAGESVSNGQTHVYKVVAFNGYGPSDDSETDNGYRGVGTLAYQWQRSAADSDASYSNISGGTTDPYNDTGAPINGAGRYYKCVLSATGATSQTSTANRGYIDPLPHLTTSSPSSVDDFTVTANGNMTDIGNTTPVMRGFKYGLTQADTWDVHEDGTFSTGSFSLPLTGLSSNTKYYIRAYATSAYGTGYGSYIEFTTSMNVSPLKLQKNLDLRKNVRIK